MRLLWIGDINSEDPNIVTYRFCRVIFGMNCSPFLLNAAIKYHVTKYYALEPVLAQNTLEGLYVDDWTSGGENDHEVYALYKTTNACFASGGFNLRKWAGFKQERSYWEDRARSLEKRTAEREWTPLKWRSVLCKDDGWWFRRDWSF